MQEDGNRGLNKYEVMEIWLLMMDTINENFTQI